MVSMWFRLIFGRDKSDPFDTVTVIRELPRPCGSMAVVG